MLPHLHAVTNDQILTLADLESTVATIRPRPARSSWTAWPTEYGSLLWEDVVETDKNIVRIRQTGVCRCILRIFLNGLLIVYIFFIKLSHYFFLFLPLFIYRDFIIVLNEKHNKLFLNLFLSKKIYI